MTKRLYSLVIATMLLSTSTVWSQSNNEMRKVYTEAEPLLSCFVYPYFSDYSSHQHLTAEL